jgi:hypothetical protein
MAERKPITSAPKDGSQVTVYWTDRDGIANESLARWEDGGWWAHIDSDTKKRIEPSSWRPATDDDDE